MPCAGVFGPPSLRFLVLSLSEQSDSGVTVTQTVPVFSSFGWGFASVQPSPEPSYSISSRRCARQAYTSSKYLYTCTLLCYEVCAALPPCCAALHAARARALRLLRARAWPALACTGLEVSVTCDTGLYARARASANSQARNHQERRRRRGCRDVTVALSLRRLRQYFSTVVLGYSNNALCGRVRPAFSALLGAVPL